MSLETLGWVLIIAGVLLVVFGYVYIVGSKTLDRLERQVSMLRHPASQLPSYSITYTEPASVLYDHAAGGDFE